MSKLKTGMIILYKLTKEECMDKYILNDSLMNDFNPIMYSTKATKIVVNNNLPCAPAIITAVFPNEYGDGIDGVNCKVFLDSGFVDIWKTSIKLGHLEGEFTLID
jgi:hypothetical protein